VIPVASYGPHRLFDPRAGHGGMHLRPRTPISVAAGPAVDLSKWVGVEPTAANLQAITQEVMAALTDLLVEIRGEQPPAADDAVESGV